MSLSAAFNLNARKDAYDHSCFLARLNTYQRLMTLASTPTAQAPACSGSRASTFKCSRAALGVLWPAPAVPVAKPLGVYEQSMESTRVSSYPLSSRGLATDNLT